MARSPRVDQTVTLASAARIAGVARSTIISAVKRGELTPHHTACDSRLLLLADVERWAAAASTRRPGRPKAE